METVTGAWRIVQRNALVYRRAWRGSLFMGFLQPLLFLLSIGIGVGSLMRTPNALPDGVPFLAFLGSGLLASTCMQTASFESSFPILGKMTWQKNYEAICATPVSIGGIVLGELAWIGIRLTMVATAFAVVLVGFGVATSMAIVPAVASAILTGLAFSAVVMAYAATLTNGANFNALFRFGITPLLLFSGVFFPVSRLPESVRWLAPFTPLYHGVEMSRGVLLHTLGLREAFGHISYLVTMLLLGLVAAHWTFSRRLWR